MAAKAAVKKAGPVSVQPAQVYTRINSLLHTLRTIAQREDQLCILMHHLRTAGKLSSAMTAELHQILEEIPAHEYLHDLDALRTSLQDTEDGGKAVRAKSPAKRRAA